MLMPLSSSPLYVHLTLNHTLDSPCLRIRRRLKSLDRVLNIKAMGHQAVQVDHPTLHQANGPRPRIRIPILELLINFLGTQSHERDLHFRLANTDDENLPTEFHAVDGGVDAALDTGTLECYGRLDAAG